jgi:hypothetical protein
MSNSQQFDPTRLPAPQGAAGSGAGSGSGRRSAGRGAEHSSSGGASDGGSGAGDSGGFRGRKVTTCSFCGKTSREVGPMVEGPNDIYICSNCTDLCQNIFRQERRRVSSARPLFSAIPAPRQIREFLDTQHAVYRYVPDTAALCDFIADRLAEGQVIGWFQPDEPEKYLPASFPVIILFAEEGSYYLTPIWGAPGVKPRRVRVLS